MAAVICWGYCKKKTKQVIVTDNCETSELCFSEKVIYIMTIFIYVYINKYIHIYICIFYTFCVFFKISFRVSV